MKLLKTGLLVAGCALLMTACKDKAETAAELAAENPLLDYVPADTPYLFANLDTTPEDVVDAYLERFQPSLDMVQTLLDDIQLKVSEDASGDMQAVSLVAALLEEADGKLNRQGLESLGFSLESHKAVYGMGAFPVVRVALEDPAALRAAIARVETRSGMTLPMARVGETEYWRLVGGGSPVAVYMAILDGHVAVSAFPTAMEDSMLPEFLGLAEPAQVFDANRALAGLNTDKGFLAYGSGYVDLRRLADELMSDGSRTREGLAAAGMVPPALDAVCMAEVQGLIDRAPRFVFGTTELTTDTIGILYQLEIEETLAGQMIKLVSDVPPAPDNSDDLAALSLGIQVGRLREFLLEKVSAMAAEPFQCPRLEGLNRMARQAMNQVNRPMPPFIGNLNGLRLRLESMDLDNLSPSGLRGMAVLEVEKPQMLIGSAQMFIPGLENLELEAGGDPVEIPEELARISAEGMDLLAAMSSDALGISLGKDQQAGLMDFLEEDTDNGGTFFSVSYDMAAQMELQSRMRQQMLGRSGHDATGDENEEAREVIDMMNRLEASYRDMMGHARLEFRFTPGGLEIYNRMTFN